jgi:hypothetical protein
MNQLRWLHRLPADYMASATHGVRRLVRLDPDTFYALRYDSSRLL